MSTEEYIWPTSFFCTLITDKLILPVQYNIAISIEPVAPPNLALGFRRLRTFVDFSLQTSIFINQEHFLSSQLLNIDTNAVYFPTEPYDYFVGSILLRKFQKITEKYFNISFITIDSDIGDHVQYCIRDPEETGLDLNGEYWWNMDTIDTGSGSGLSWTDLDLHDNPKFEPRIIKGGRSEDR